MSVLGIDVSHFQGEIDWDAVARSEMRFAFVKASEGNTMVDSRFQRNWTACQDAGLPSLSMTFPLRTLLAMTETTAFSLVAQGDSSVALLRQDARALLGAAW